jgi:hypothetical protein
MDFIELAEAPSRLGYSRFGTAGMAPRLEPSESGRSSLPTKNGGLALAATRTGPEGGAEKGSVLDRLPCKKAFGSREKTFAPRYTMNGGDL